MDSIGNAARDLIEHGDRLLDTRDVPPDIAAVIRECQAAIVASERDRRRMQRAGRFDAAAHERHTKALAAAAAKLDAVRRPLENARDDVIELAPGQALTDLTDTQLDGALSEQRCLNCGVEVEGDETSREKMRDKLRSWIADHQGVSARDIKAVRAITWCDDCQVKREAWLSIIDRALSGERLSMPDQADLLHAIERTRRVARIVKERANMTAEEIRQVIGGNTARVLDAVARLDEGMLGAATESVVPFVGSTLMQRRAVRHGGRGHEPTWAGTHSFAKAAAACRQGADVEWVTPARSTEELLSPAGLLYLKATTYMPRAHPIVVAPGQVDALPAMTHREAHDVAKVTHLPFPVVYFDFTDANGATPHGDIRFISDDDDAIPIDATLNHEMTANLVGALVWESDDEEAKSLGAPGVEGRRLMILPFHQTDDPRGGAWQIETYGLVCIGGPALLDDCSIEVKGATRVPVRGVASLLRDSDLTGWVIPAMPAQLITEVAARETSTSMGAVELAMCSGATWALSVAVLQVMHFMGSVNVDVTPEAAPMHKREVKRANKRGWKIASTVTIRRRTARPRKDPTGASRDYAYQFERAAHENHVKRGPHVRCAPCRGEGQSERWFAAGVEVGGPGLFEVEGTRVNAEVERRTCEGCNGTGLDPAKIKPCIRRDTEGNLTCPDGCRREFVPSTVVGPADKPLMLKTRVVRS